MKLTNISLAILVAIGLVACGGSDDNKNQPTDNNNAGHQGAGNGNPPPPPPPKGDSALDPKRKAPDLTVAGDIKDIVAANKRVFVDRGFSDTALGYDASGTGYDKNLGTDPANIKLTSNYNFYAENDLVTEKKVTFNLATMPTGATDYSDQSVGAIYVGSFDDIKTGKANAFVKFSGDKYARVKMVPLNPAVGKNEYSPLTEFELTDASKTDPEIAGKPSFVAKKFSQNEIVFIANVQPGTGAPGSKDIINLGTVGDFVVTKGQVLLDSVNVFGQKYAADSIGDNLNFGSLKPMREIQTTDITGSYTIINNKNTANNTDDKRVTNSISLGKMKAYNLPYSIALVTTNIDEKNPLEKDVFKLKDGGAFQVLGFKTVSLPQNGRALYTGKSFSAKNTGDVTLYADFFEDRAGIQGVIDNRKDFKGNNLPPLTLEDASFVPYGNQNYKTEAKGDVKGAPSYANKWTVQLYGPEAEEAAGTLLAPNGTIKEVYNTQRGALTNKSNDSTVTP